MKAEVTLTDSFDKPRDECGVFGMYNTVAVSDVAAANAYYALYALQHRGQESCGICVGDDGLMKVHKGLGLVPEVFTPQVLASLGSGNMSIGHVRYSTTGAPQIDNAQPILVHHVKGSMALVHNGNLTNSNELREELELRGGIFHTTSDTEVIAYTITQARLTEPSIENAVAAAMHKLKGAYSLVIMSPRKLIAVRDPQGFRPLCMGRMGSAVMFASESCAFSAIGAEFVRDVEPGEIIVASPDGIRSIRDHCGGKSRLCVMEYVYIARRDSILEGVSVHAAHKRAGALLARAHPVDADVVIGLPDSGLDAALGYAEESGIPYGFGVSINRYVGRTFIQPTQSERTQSVHIKLTPIAATVEGKRVVVVDDSIIRGTSTRHILNLIRLAGAKEIHMRIASPPFKHPCYFGIDVDNYDDLIANRYPDVDAIARALGADSVGYLSVEDVSRIANVENAELCVGCFSGNYPIDPPQTSSKRKFERPLSEKMLNNTAS